MSAAARLDQALTALDANFEASLERLFALLRIPSVSTEAAHHADCARCADALRADLAGMGFRAETIHVDGAEPGAHPLVLATAGPTTGPRVLFYGHYDVQPVDPLPLWTRPPFEPRLESRPDGSQMIRARGASDDKGQLMTFVEACRAWMTAGGLPLGVTVLLEGEEEAGGSALAAFLPQAKERLAADVALVCDTNQWVDGRPAITASLRGMAGGTLRIRCAERDLHSGHYGGSARNPLQVLSRILADLHDETGRVTLPGFYDGVPEVPPALAAAWEKLGFDEAAFLGEIGLSAPAGEAGRPALERLWARPTAEINGVSGGYQGDGFKTVIAAEAMAKVSFRLVGDQDPAAVWAAFRDHVAARTPSDCAFELEEPHGSAGVTLPYDSPAIVAASAALADEFGAPPPVIGAGGSVPVVTDFKTVLGMDSLMVGFAREDDQIHSPNEKYELESFRRGQRAWARIMAALADRA